MSCAVDCECGLPRQIAERVFRAMMRNGSPRYVYATWVTGLCSAEIKRMFDNTLSDINMRYLAHSASLLVHEFLESVGLERQALRHDFPRVPCVKRVPERHRARVQAIHELQKSALAA